MIRAKLTPPIAAVLLLLLPSVSQGAGLITGLTASPNPAQVSQDVTFTVKGTSGGCGDLTIDFGDGQSTNLASVGFSDNTNTTATHKYAAASTFAAKATPGKGCTGTAAVNVSVGAGGSGGTGGTGGTGGSGGGMVSTYRPGLRNLVTQLPLIEEMFMFSQIRPGGAVILKGRYFGEQPGQFRIKLASGLVSNLGELTWKNDAVSGIIDANISGVMDQDAKLQLVDANGREGNEWPVPFTARREVKPLTQLDFQCTAEDKSDSDTCGLRNPGLGSDFSISGGHNCFGDPMDALTGCNAAGVDTFWGNLANGWRIYEVVKLSVARGALDAWVQDPVTIAEGGPGPIKISVGWDTGKLFVAYQFKVYVEGPAGTSWK